MNNNKNICVWWLIGFDMIWNMKLIGNELLNKREGGGGSGTVEVVVEMLCWFTGRDDGREQIAIGKSFNWRLSGIERCAVNVIAGAANIVSAHVRSRSEAVTRRRVRAQVASVTRITAIRYKHNTQLTLLSSIWNS